MEQQSTIVGGSGDHHAAATIGGSGGGGSTTVGKSNNDGAIVIDPYKSMEFLDALDDVHTRFLLNLPDGELDTSDRIFFQLEQAWWFYEDWICDPIYNNNNNNDNNNNKQQKAGKTKTTKKKKQQEESDDDADGDNDHTDDNTDDKDNDSNDDNDNKNDSISNNNKSIVLLPRFTSFKSFAYKLFDYSPLLPSANTHFQSMWNEFTQYKRTISNYGCILLNTEYTHIVLCKLWNSDIYTLPSGKINQNEDGITAAIRETYEETGFDPQCIFGITSIWYKQQQQQQYQHDKITWTFPLSEDDALFFQEDNHHHHDANSNAAATAAAGPPSATPTKSRHTNRPTGKRRTCYVVHGVPMDFPFEPVARKEVSMVGWYPINNIPKPSFAVRPFIPQLKKWIKKKQQHMQIQQQQQPITIISRNKTPTKSPIREERGGVQRTRSATKRHQQQQQQGSVGGSRSTPTKRDRQNHYNDHASNNAPPSSSGGSRNNSRGRGGARNSKQGGASIIVGAHDDVVRSGLANEGEYGRWKEEDMFRANQRLILNQDMLQSSSNTDGGNYYDGRNPQVFAEHGFAAYGGRDPHTFHVVGGAFLNSQQDQAKEGTSSNAVNDLGMMIMRSGGEQRSTSRLRPLFRQQERQNNDGDGGHATTQNNDDDLQPFFTDDGVTPWGEVVEDAMGISVASSTATPGSGTEGGGGGGGGGGRRRLNSNKNKKDRKTNSVNCHPSGKGDDIVTDDMDLDSHTIIPTDAEIRAGKMKKAGPTAKITTTTTTKKDFETNDIINHTEIMSRLKLKYEQDMADIRTWVKNLPKAKPSKYFGGDEFKLDVDAIMMAFHRTMDERQQQLLGKK